MTKKTELYVCIRWIWMRKNFAQRNKKRKRKERKGNIRWKVNSPIYREMNDFRFSDFLHPPSFFLLLLIHSLSHTHSLPLIHFHPQGFSLQARCAIIPSTNNISYRTSLLWRLKSRSTAGQKCQMWKTHKMEQLTSPTAALTLNTKIKLSARGNSQISEIFLEFFMIYRFFCCLLKFHGSKCDKQATFNSNSINSSLLINFNCQKCNLHSRIQSN